MKKSIFLTVPLAALCLVSLASLCAAEELNWGQRLVGPVEGSDVHHAESFDFSRYSFVSGPAVGGTVPGPEALEGKRSSALYKAPSKTSFEVFSAYKRFFKDKGYDVVYMCEGGACGDKFRSAWYDLNPFERDPNWNNSAPLKNGDPAKQFYLAAVRKSAAGNTYVSVYGSSGWWNYPAYRVDVTMPAAPGAGVVQASRIAETMKADGRMAFYGITFDTGSSEIKAESAPVLAEIASFLKKSQGSVFYVAGHTDDEGDFQANMKLSQARAEAVAKDLISKGVPAAMLSAHGTGPLSPVAANFTPEGRALNRRVEIVKTLRGGGAPAARSAQQQAVQQQVQDAQQQVQQAASAAAAAAQAAAEKVAAAKAAADREAERVAAEREAAKVSVPKVTGMWRSPGTDLLVGQGFKVKHQGKAVGIIQKQDPAPNTRVEKGSTVIITVGN